MTALAPVLASACSDPGSAAGLPASRGSVSERTTSAATKSAPDGAADRAAAESAYRAFWPVLTTFDRRYPEAKWAPVMAEVAVDPQLSQALAVARQQRRAGVRLYGQPRPGKAQVTVDGAGDRAIVVDCADFSDYGQASVRTGKPTTVGTARTLVRATLSRGADGAWRVGDVAYPGGVC